MPELRVVMDKKLNSLLDEIVESGLYNSKAELEALNYLEQCDKVRRIQGSLKGLAQYYVRRFARIGLKPLSLPTMKERHPNLYAIIQRTLKI